MRIEKWSPRENALIFYQILPTNSLRKCEEISWENLYVDIGALRVFCWCPTLYQVQGQAPSEHLKIRLFTFLFPQSNNRCHGIKWMVNTCKGSPSLNRSSFQGISSFNTDSLNRTSKKKAKDIISCVYNILIINVKNYIENGIYYFSVGEQSVFSFECFSLICKVSGGRYYLKHVSYFFES